MGTRKKFADDVCDQLIAASTIFAKAPVVQIIVERFNLQTK